MSRSPGLPAAFASIYASEIQYVLRALRRLGVQSGDVEDLAHDVFLAAFRRFDDYDATRPARSWLFGFAYRKAADHRKLFRHKYEKQTDADMADVKRLQDDQLADEQARRILLRALDDLDLERRAIFIMHELEEHPMPEISRELGVPLNTAYSRLRLARRDFETAVKRISSGSES